MVIAILLIMSMSVPLAIAAGSGSGPSVWDLEIVDNSISKYSPHLNPSLVWGNDGIAHISYCDGKGIIRYAVMDHGKWTTKTVASSKGTLSTSIALDGKGKPAMAFGNGFAFGNLMYAFQDGKDWVVMTADNGGSVMGNVGLRSSLAFDSAGLPHIAYNNGLNYAQLQYATLTEPYTIHTAITGGLWDRRVVDTGSSIIGDTGYEPSLVIDPADKPFIAYRDGNSFADLMVAHQNEDGDWDITTVDNGGSIFGDTGYRPSMALDSAGHPHISYYDAGNGDLRYASWNGASWELETLDAKGDVGAYSSLAIGSHDQPFISYYDATKQTLRFVTKNPATHKWMFWTIDEGDVGTLTSLAIDPLGHPSVAYYDAANHALKYARWDWDNETLQYSTENTGIYTALAMDRDGNPVIAYYDRTDKKVS